MLLVWQSIKCAVGKLNKDLQSTQNIHDNTDMYCRPIKINFLTTQSGLLITPKKKAIDNIVRNGENAGNQYFLLFPQCSPLIPMKNFNL